MKTRVSQMRVLVLLLSFSALFTLQSCRYRYGTTAESFPPARTPKGVTGRVVTSRTTYSAELIQVGDTGIVILAGRIFRFVPYSAIASSRFDGISDSISHRTAPSGQIRERLRLVSRFPQQLMPELLQKLLSANGQA